MKDVLLIVDPPGAGSWNMAVDEALMHWSATQDQPTLRFYQWSEPTLSLGYFQTHAERKVHATSLRCPLVRRASGGGAIMHDCELTYSYSMPVSPRKATQATELYDAFHGTLITLLQSWGVSACFAGDDHSLQTHQPFLCFQRRSWADVLVDGEKIAGSAQRKQRGALLQHGSVLLRRSACAPELPGLDQWLELSAETLTTQWQQIISKTLQLRLTPASLPPAVVEQAKVIEAEKFASPAWTQRR